MRYITLIIFGFITILILRINVKLHSENYTSKEIKEDIILQLNFLEDQLKYKDLGYKMQQIFPEGFVFVNALYGLAWCELALSNPEDYNLKDRALIEAIYAFKCVDSEKARLTFPNYLDPENGIFYEGWRNYLLSKILLVDTSFNDSQTYLLKFKTQSDRIAKALLNSDSPYIESYSGQTWPADTYVAMASLSNYRIIDNKYLDIIDSWIIKVKGKLDNETGLIPHKVDWETAQTIQGARGCSIGLILRMLSEIDMDFANQQFQLADSLFINTTLGLPSMREYPEGKRGLGDIDSGPVIFGVGFSATIVMIGTLAIYRNSDLAERQYKTIHAFGFDKIKKNQKMYLFGKLPMADAFIVWGRATMLNNINKNDPKRTTWRFKFHLFSFFLCTLIWIFYFRKTIILKYKTATNMWS